MHTSDSDTGRPAAGRSVSQLALVRDLLEPAPTVFWTDFAASALLAWGAFALALLTPLWSMPMLAATVVAVFAFYRGLCFIHEIEHLRGDRLQGFALAWNALIGVPFLFPLFLYQGVHRDHHAAATYGTIHDPEYLPLAGKRGAIVGLLAGGLLLPLLLVLRFAILSIPGLLWPRFHRWLERHASSLVMNLKYVREVDAATRRRIRLTEACMLIAWLAAALFAWYGILPWRAFGLWGAIVLGIVTLNNLRALVAHGYAGNGTRMSREAQIADSFDTPGRWWTALWAPVGLRYHSLHHLYPTIPYHNLATAYRRLRAAPEPPGTRSRPSLWAGVRALWSAPVAAAQAAGSDPAPVKAPVRQLPLPRSARPAAR
jgi:fatty acid desaturase